MGGGSFNASGPCGAPPYSVCQHGGVCLPLEPEPEPEMNSTASWIEDEANARALGRCSCPRGWAGRSCEQLDLSYVDAVYASAGLALLLCLLCCMVNGDPERRRIAVREREEGYRSSKLSEAKEPRCSSCTDAFEGMMDALAALPLGWKIAWGVGSLVSFALSVTLLVVVPGCFVILLSLWTACIVKVGSQYTGSLLDATVDDGPLGSEFELATFTAANIVSRTDDVSTSLLHSSGSRGKTWQEKVRDSPHGRRADSAAFSSF